MVQLHIRKHLNKATFLSPSNMKLPIQLSNKQLKREFIQQKPMTKKFNFPPKHGEIGAKLGRKHPATSSFQLLCHPRSIT